MDRVKLVKAERAHWATEGDRDESSLDSELSGEYDSTGSNGDDKSPPLIDLLESDVADDCIHEFY